VSKAAQRNAALPSPSSRCEDRAVLSTREYSNGEPAHSKRNLKGSGQVSFSHLSPMAWWPLLSRLQSWAVMCSYQKERNPLIDLAA